MADEPEDDVLVLGEALDDVDDTQPAADGDDTLTAADDDDLELPTFADDGEEEPSDTDLVKHLRAELRRTQADKKALEQGAKPEPAIIVGEEPTLESCEYDDDRFKAELRAYDDRKRRAEEQANKGRESQRAADEQWDREKAEFAKKRAALPYRDIDDVEAVVAASLEPAQLAMIVKAANDGPKLVYALGKNPAKLSALAGVKDPIKFIAATVRLEGEMKMAKRRPTVEPDRIVRGSASSAAGAVDRHEQKLEAEADRTGNRSALIKYRSEKKDK
jgi:hypothetical protein